MSLLTSLVGPVTGLLDKFIPDADEKMKIAAELSSMAERHAQELAKGQLEVNKVEAASKSMFVAGWRPFTGWICASAMAYHYILQPLLTFILYSAGNEVVLPTFDMGTLTTVLLGMLGLGGMRSFEKVKRSA